MFVGRDAERRALLEPLDAPGERCVFRVTGPAGIGKTALLVEVARACATRGLPYVWLDALEGELTRERVVEVARELAVRQRASGAAGRVLFVDDVHFLRGLERWFASRFLELEEGITVVLADRQALSPAWAEGCSVPSRTLHLGPLPRDAVQAFLAEKRVPDSQRAAIVDFAEGNALLASLGADAGVAGGGLGLVEDVLARLATGMCSACEDPSERLAVAVVMVARASPLEMLRAILGDAMSPEIALRSLLRQSMIDETPLGLRPHDLARRAALAHLRVHYASLLAQAVDAVRAWCDAQIASQVDPTRWLLDRAFLDRHHPAWRGGFPAGPDPVWQLGPAQPGDLDRVRELARTNLGDAFASAMTRWCVRPEATIDVLRDERAGFVGFAVTRLLDAEAVRTDGDPLFAVIERHLAAVGWSKGEGRVMVGCACSVGGWRPFTPAGAVLLARMAARVLQAQSVDFVFVDTDRPDAWLAWLTQIGIAVAAVGTVERTGGPRTVLALDWRGRSPRQVFARSSVMTGVAPAGRLATPPDDFAALLDARVRDLAARSHLTVREREVLDLLVLGRSAADIALVLQISPRTVKFHQQNVLEKVGADSRLDLFRLLL